MTINVTQGHITKGIRGTSVMCPVALAIREATGQIASVHSHKISIYRQVIDSINEWRGSPPDAVRKFILNFDAGHYVEPFMFELDYRP